MNRILSSINKQATLASIVSPVLFFSGAFKSGTVRANSASQTLSFDAEQTGSPVDFAGVGPFGTVEAIEDGSQLQSYPLRIHLSGIPGDMISRALGEEYQGCPARLWLGFLGEDQNLIGDPLPLYAGAIDTMEIEVGQQATVTLTIQSYLADWERPPGGRMSNDDQQIRFPRDQFFRFTAQLSDRKIIWGR